MRIVVDERGIVAGLLAGAPASAPASDLVDEGLRAIAIAEVALRAWRRTPLDEDLVALARVQGVGISTRDCEILRREGAMATRRAAA